MNTVYLSKITEYDENIIYDYFETYLSNLNLDIKPTDKIAIKLNALAPFPSDKGITTHPIILKALVRYLKQYTNNIYVGDNPATKGMIQTMKVNGTYDVCVKEGLNIIDDKNIIKIIDESKSNRVSNDFDVTNDFIECDYFFNLAKLKTHGFAYYTGCVKNLFGLIYGLNKASYHLKFNNIDIFSDCICDLYNTFNINCKAKKIIHIIDGILGLEGEGPGAKGVSKKGNALIMGLDPFSVDIVAMNVVSLDYKKSYIHVKGKSRNLGNCSLENIEIIGNKINDFDVKFEEPDTVKGIGAIKFIEKVNLKRFFFESPKFNNLCVKCKECIKICPAKALSIKNDKVVVNKEKCIRCWCCQEVCPYKAIDKSKRPILGRIFFR